MNTIPKNLLIVASLVLLFTSCSKDVNTDPADPSGPKAMSQLNVGNQFDYRTDQNVTVELRALANDNQPLKGVRFDILTNVPEDGGNLILSGVTAEDGFFRSAYPFPVILTRVIVTTAYIGLPHELEIEVVNGKISGTFGGRSMVMKSGGKGITKASNIDFYYMGSFNSQGVPNYLEPVNEVIDPTFLADINASFPESVPINPTYLDLSNEHDFKLTEACDVWVVFVSEGAGYKNTLGYYTYDLNNPPASPAQIDSGMIIFPNVSFLGSGGGLQTGNKVYLGQFPGGTGIGFFLKANAFSNGQVGNGLYTYYTNPAFNPETLPNKKKHSVILVDHARDLFLMGFEDLFRQGHSDEDFNDAIFLVKANPIENVETDNFPVPEYTGNDTDGDGIPDNLDEYPNDPNRAFNNYYPSAGAYATLGFEDLWPSRGDYDFNDMVIDYNINQVTNAQNQVVDIKPTYILRAMGASYRNGFGIQLNLPPAQIQSVTGQVMTEGIVALNPNGTEAGQSKAVIMVFEDGYKVLPYPGGGVTGVNTTPGAPYATPDTLRLGIYLNTPATMAQVGLPPFNPFIFVNGTRGREVHLPDYSPTDLANPAYFGQNDDTSDPGQNRYYKTANNLPWAINIVERFDYPIEKAPIINAHLKFAPWAESNGTQYPDWYLNKPGYRNPANIYQ